MKKILLVCTMLVVIFSLTACKEDTKKSGGSVSKEAAYTVNHAMGKIEISAKPKKIVVLTNEGVEALLSMGVTPVGAVKSWTGDPWYDHTKEKLKDTKVVGTESEVNVEAIAALQPDLIIGNKMRQEKIYEQLNKIAPTVYAETLRGDWKENFTLYAKAINKEDEGKKVLSNYEKRVSGIKSKLGDKTQQKISMVRFMAGDVRIYHLDTFSGVILKELGFVRPEGQNINDFAERNLTKERMSAMDGDILFYFTYETGNNAASKLENEWINDPLFKNLSVSKNNKVFKVDDVIWNTAGGVLAANLMLDDIEKRFLQ